MAVAMSLGVSAILWFSSKDHLLSWVWNPPDNNMTVEYAIDTHSDTTLIIKGDGYKNH